MLNLAERVDELESDAALILRVGTGIRDGGERRRGVLVSEAGECGVEETPTDRGEARSFSDRWLSGEKAAMCGGSGGEVGRSSVTILMVELGGCGVDCDCELGIGSSLAPSTLGIPYPGVAASWSPTTSPKKGCRVVPCAGEATFFLGGTFCVSTLDRTPLTPRAFEGVDGAG